MHDLYESTSLSKKKVALKTGFLDWNLQPSIFKHYPSSLFSYPLSSTPQLKVLHLARCVTSEHQIGGKPYKRLSTPSAGNLHPLEMYVQIRGVQGILSGIYHVDSDRDKLVLIRDIDADGIEHEVGLSERFKGMIIMVSTVPFRSIWKYQDRAIRYCYLDLGHQLCAIQAAGITEKQDVTFLSDFDVLGLSTAMGMSEQEQVLNVVLCGEKSQKAAKELSSPLMQVQPTDYYEKHAIQSEILKRHQIIDSPVIAKELKTLPGLEDLIVSRRSARNFILKQIRKESLEQIMHFLLQLPQSISCYIVLLRGEAYDPGIYQDSCLQREGVFINEIVDLLLHQQFIFNASLVLVFSSPSFNARLLTQTAYFVHALSLLIHAMNLGLSGVGAFYDKALQDFLDTDEKILYTVAIGDV